MQRYYNFVKPDEVMQAVVTGLMFWLIPLLQCVCINFYFLAGRTMKIIAPAKAHYRLSNTVTDYYISRWFMHGWQSCPRSTPWILESDPELLSAVRTVSSEGQSYSQACLGLVSSLRLIPIPTMTFDPPQVFVCQVLPNTAMTALSQPSLLLEEERKEENRIW